MTSPPQAPRQQIRQPVDATSAARSAPSGLEARHASPTPALDPNAVAPDFPPHEADLPPAPASPAMHTRPTAAITPVAPAVRTPAATPTPTRVEPSGGTDTASTTPAPQSAPRVTSVAGPQTPFVPSSAPHAAIEPRAGQPRFSVPGLEHVTVAGTPEPEPTPAAFRTPVSPAAPVAPRLPAVDRGPQPQWHTPLAASMPVESLPRPAGVPVQSIGAPVVPAAVPVASDDAPLASADARSAIAAPPVPTKAERRRAAAEAKAAAKTDAAEAKSAARTAAAEAKSAARTAAAEAKAAAKAATAEANAGAAGAETAARAATEQAEHDTARTIDPPVPAHRTGSAPADPGVGATTTERVAVSVAASEPFPTRRSLREQAAQRSRTRAAAPVSPIDGPATDAAPAPASVAVPGGPVPASAHATARPGRTDSRHRTTVPEPRAGSHAGHASTTRTAPGTTTAPGTATTTATATATAEHPASTTADLAAPTSVAGTAIAPGPGALLGAAFGIGALGVAAWWFLNPGTVHVVAIILGILGLVLSISTLRDRAAVSWQRGLALLGLVFALVGTAVILYAVVAAFTTLAGMSLPDLTGTGVAPTLNW